MSAERRWVLESRGRYSDGSSDGDVGSVELAWKYPDRERAERAAQVSSHCDGRAGRGFRSWRAVPVECETRRRVEETGESLRYVLRHREGGYVANLEGHRVEIQRAMTFTATGLWRYTWEDRCEWTPVAIGVTERPTEWQVVEEHAP